MSEILVYGEIVDGLLHPITGELLSAGRDLNGDLSVALLGDDLNGASSEAISLGADKVYLVGHPLLAGQPMDALVSTFEQICRQVAPAVVLAGKTEIGQDLIPRVAFRLGVGLANDCVEVRDDSETGRVVAKRPVYGGNATATVTFADADPQVVLMRSKAYEPPEADSSRAGEVVDVQVDLEPSVITVRRVGTVRREVAGLRIEDAPVVVSGGRGLGGPGPFETLKELADLLGGAVGASRAVCDAGWIDHSYQVGLTGKTVAPELYITVGISGASQHMAGCSGAKNIVAINRDPDANIFKEANYGVVGDWKNIFKGFIEAVRELRQS